MSEYRLEPVRTLRAVGERTREGELADAVEDARARADQLAAAAARTTAAREKLARARAATYATAHERARGDQYLARLRRDLEDALAGELRARAAHAQTTGAVGVARARVIAARAEREVVERHFGRWREQQRKLAERKAED